ncbi:ParM/StbA family protein [Lysinibacillus sp. NPDC093688]|uniref:ParM/StbA family protein n=1 Tax=Lysinibacillus sp. NPDC093688 TaxID=3390577 RepID=UPI003D05CEB7
MNRIILGIDAGNHKAKVVGPFGVDSFKTNICDWFERDVEESFGPDDMEFEVDDRKGFAGTIAQFEDEFGDGTRYGDSKAHEDTKIRVLLAIHRYLGRYCPHIEKVSFVTGQPIKRHKKAEKESIIEMLKGNHEIKMNGKSRKVSIEQVAVAPEGSGAFWVRPSDGIVRVIDIGSGTVNAATIIDKRHINNASTTFNFGVETVANKDDLQKIARGIIRNTTKLKWDKDDKTLICGGITEGIASYIAEHYINAEIINPTIARGNGVTTLHPVFANAVGFYEIAKGAFG